jgi:nicotinamide mononucleotide adenylyltransferase
MSTPSTGVIHGRFQPLHLGHMEYLLAGKSRCQFLFIGITNPDPGLTSDHSADLKRSLPMSNPLTYYERQILIKDALLEAGVRREEFDIVPFPINYPHLIQYYVPMDSHFFVTIYDDWGRVKAETLRSLGVKVEVMWERSMEDRLTSGTRVRQLLSTQGPWESLVPSVCVRKLQEFGLAERLRKSR